MQTREAADLRHLKQVARGLYAAGLYTNYRDALVKADEVRRRADELQIAWADEPQPRLLRFRAMLRRVLDGGHLGSRYLRARNVRAGHFALSFAR